ncbi:MAG: hypothetical protein AABO58_15925 [Acidobacteriota bacterium]
MKWLPSRHHFALARLIALMMLKTTPRPAADVDRVMFAVDRHQSTAENYAVSILFTAITTCYIATMLPLAAPLALVSALPLALIAIQILLVAGGLIVRSIAANSAFMMLCAVAASLYFATRTTWVRFAAYTFLAVVALNAIAFVVMWLLRDRVRELELRCAA